MFKFLRRNKKVTTVTKKTNNEEMKNLVKEFIDSYNNNDIYYKISYYDTTCGMWKETNTIFNSRQEARDATTSIMRNCHSITPGLIKVKSYVY